MYPSMHTRTAIDSNETSTTRKNGKDSAHASMERCPSAAADTSRKDATSGDAEAIHDATTEGEVDSVVKDGKDADGETTNWWEAPRQASMSL